MYKVFFADDEAAMRTGLRESIIRGGSDFVLVGEASDGEFALSLIAETLPDILITDVRMPFMDGIELSRRVSRTMPWVKIIILSGHDEFEYAKEAIKIGVTEYILKPVTSETLFGVLKEAARLIEDERERRRAVEILQKEVSDARGLQMERVLSNLVYGIPDSAPLESVGLADFMSRPSSLVSVVEAVPLSPGDARAVFRAISSIRAAISQNDNVKSFPEGAGRIVCVFAAKDEGSLEEDAYAAAQAMKYEVERSSPCLVRVAIGSPVTVTDELPKSMTQAIRALDRLDDAHRSMILGFRDIDGLGLGFGLGKDVCRGVKQSRYGGVIEKSRDFIKKRYADSAISLNIVADAVGLSPNHFSTVFSQETGETFIECLTKTRLGKAMELLHSTSARASEIACMIGYNDPHYFSYVFRKNVGMSPSEYRNSRLRTNGKMTS
ncbi:MAG: response regulator [Synergistaceae bacterium]|jgi:two-component system response regulator YesN|nr:response regulator [Synergistaceae bacterium]